MGAQESRSIFLSCFIDKSKDICCFHYGLDVKLQRRFVNVVLVYSSVL